MRIYSTGVRCEYKKFAWKSRKWTPRQRRTPMPLAYSHIIHRERRNIEELSDNRPTNMTKPLSWRTKRNMVSAEIPVYRYRCRKWSSFYSTLNHIATVPQVNHKSIPEKQNTVPGFCCSRHARRFINYRIVFRKKHVIMALIREFHVFVCVWSSVFSRKSNFVWHFLDPSCSSYAVGCRLLTTSYFLQSKFYPNLWW